MAIRIRRGTDAQRAITTFLDGEIIWTTDLKEFWVGDGLTVGGILIGPSAGGGGLLSGNAIQTSAGVYDSTIVGVTAYNAGDTYMIKFDSTNNGASTLNINTLGAVNIFKNTIIPLSSGDIKTDQEIIIVYDGTNFQAIGLISTQLLAYVHNSEGAIISKGQVVYAYQATGNKMSVKLARADSDSTSAKTIGMVYDSTIGIGGEGYIIIQGVIEGINTAAFSAGDTLYLSGTTYGDKTNVKPYAPTHLVYVGIVERANAGNGQIYVRCQNGYELDEIHDVDLISTPPVNNDVLTYITGVNNLWKPRSISSILGYIPYDSSNPASYITLAALAGYLTSATAAVTYYPLTNPSGYISGITSLDVTTALGYTPYNSSNPSGYITSAALSPYLTNVTAAATYQPLDSDLTDIAGLTPANDDIIQRKAGAWTNRTIAQYYADLQPSVKDDVYFTVPFIPAVLSPADATTYYIGAGAIAPSTTATNQDMSLPFDFTVIGAVINVGGNTAAGTTENSTMSIRNTTTSTSSTMGTFQTNGSTTVIISTTINGLSIDVNANALFCLQWLAPTWATNPTGTAVRTILICKRR
jgi:hypothetical protein